MASGLEVVFDANVELVSKIREFVAELAARSKADAEWTSQIELATHELVENAVKGSSHGKVRMRVELRERGPAMDIELRTWNHATERDLATLRQVVIETAAAGDPEAFYVDLLRRTAGLSGSGLGIGRVRAEAGMSVECEVIGDEACVIARGTRMETA